MAEIIKKKVFDWTEIYLNSPEPLTIAKIPIYEPSHSKNIQNVNLQELKTKLQELLSPEVIKYGFQAENFLCSDLLGNIRLKTGSFSTPLYPSLAKSPNSETNILEIVNSILAFYQTYFEEDPEILDWLAPILIQKNRVNELIQIVNQFRKNNSLPLKFEIFFILVGIYSNTLQNLLLTGEETHLINILYKYKFHQISKTEKNRLYDMVISRENMDLIGIIFHLFSDVYHGIRNIYPIYEVIKKNFHLLERPERREFLESYLETGRYVEIYFLMKKAYTKREIKNYFHKIKIANGKTKEIIQQSFQSKLEFSELEKKFKELESQRNLQTLSPFEILRLLETNYASKLRSEIESAYESLKYSYICNQAKAVLCFFDKDYRNFLFHLNKSGSFKNQAESLYLKGIALKELGEKQEALAIFYRLKEAFPEETEILERIEELEAG